MYIMMCEWAGGLPTVTKADVHTNCTSHHELPGHTRKHRLENEEKCKVTRTIFLNTIYVFILCDFS